MLCDLNTGSGRLARAARDLKDVWQEAREQWDDMNAAKFEKEFLQPLAPLLTQTQAAVAKFAELASEAERECQDPERSEQEM